jgi:hypothetical protein
MIKKSLVILLLTILLSIIAMPHEVKAAGIGEVALIGTAVVVAIGLISILISPSMKASQTLNGTEKNELSAESSVMKSGDKSDRIAEFVIKPVSPEYPYALNIRF